MVTGLGTPSADTSLPTMFSPLTHTTSQFVPDPGSPPTSALFSLVVEAELIWIWPLVTNGDAASIVRPQTVYCRPGGSSGRKRSMVTRKRAALARLATRGQVNIVVVGSSSLKLPGTALPSPVRSSATTSWSACENTCTQVAR